MSFVSISLLAISSASLLLPTAHVARTAIPVATVSKPDVLPQDARSLLKLFASRRISVERKESALKELAGREDRGASLLDLCLEEISNRPTNDLLVRTRFPLPLPSRRASLGTFGRLLDGMAVEAPPSDGIDEVQRQRRLLLVVLRQLAAAPKGGVWGLEREALRRRRLGATMDEMLRRTPEGLETPAYEVVASSRGGGGSGSVNWEVRKYEEFSVATTARTRAVANGPTDLKLGNPTMPSAGGFQALAGYILGGKNDRSERMAMTTPVFSRGGEMSFVLPSRFWQPDAPPPPEPVDSAVEIGRKGGGVLEESETLACLWFGGFAGADDVEQRKRELVEAVEADGEWAAVGDRVEPVLLQYNDPFTPPWKRRNEVALPVRPVQHEQ
jgi:hypothetical protein